MYGLGRPILQQFARMLLEKILFLFAYMLYRPSWNTIVSTNILCSNLIVVFNVCGLASCNLLVSVGVFFYYHVFMTPNRSVVIFVTHLSLSNAGLFCAVRAPI